MVGKAKIGIAGKEGPFNNIIKALEKLDLSFISGKRVLIKPNIGRTAYPEEGYNTHPKAVAAVIEMMKKNGATKISIGESPLVGIDTMEAFKKAGIIEVAAEYNVGLIDFDAKPPVKKKIENPRVVEETKICADVYEYDILVSVPVAKTHMHTGVTLGLKNLKGCLYRHEKVRYHQLEYSGKEYPEKTLDSAISDLLTILTPDLTVIDGYIGMEGLGPSGGEARKSDFAVASTHPLGADIYGCILMGVNHNEIPHLRLFSERLGYSMNPDDYEVVTGDYSDFVVPYKKPPKNISVKYENVKVYDCDSCSSCLSTLMLFLRRFKDDMTPYLLDDGQFHIGIGKNIENPKEGTVFVGNCTRKHKCNGIFVPGCPPVPTRIFEAITGEEPEENEPEVD